ncbi:LacI family DNA-binding transcriptional regulator [Catalinimonas niigatensis]|uniref:LacI family DNA-binding transcriptional regulator n=1 Tax=Catalinimonas niigatensis TaxID=1397264 RepID=UPI002664FB79|nr:LacI family DNA-binding transcriptional regulator [Catalinimonas niigatensis]WPP50041.1 LacI family DNA-binding transcriptional regulator [Catalinimonas niigatensis]
MNTKKEVTIYDIAKALNISAATVSRGLKDHPAIKKETKKKIVEAAQQMGYQHNIFASSLRKRKTNTIGVVVPHLNSYFMSSVIAGIEKVANQEGYNLLISQSLESVKKELANVTTMYNSRVDGLLVSLAGDTQNVDHFDFLFKKEIPLIFFDRVFEDPNCISIIINNFQAGYDATKHLIEQGCRRIVHIGGNLTSNVYADRHEGYKKALKDHQITYDPELVIIDIRGGQLGIKAAQQILNMELLPDGIFTANDTSAVACMSELKRAGIRIPQDVAIVGFNDDPIAKLIEPFLTTVHYPGYEMGELAASTLINRLNKLPVNNLNTIVLRHEVIVRESSLKKIIY